jgi:hypothetical protein
VIRAASSLLAVALAIAFAAPAHARGGGLTGGLGGGQPGPDRKDEPVRPSEGPRPTPGPLPPPPTTAQTPTPKEFPAFDEAVEALRKRIEELKKKTPQTVDVPDAASAQRELEKLRKRLEDRKKRLDVADRPAVKAFEAKQKAFDERWKDLKDAVESGRMPDGYLPDDWARKVDQYWKEKAGMEAEGAALGTHLAETRGEDLAPLEAAVRAAEEAAKAQGAADPAAAWRAHEARIAMLERSLADLLALKDELAGKAATRQEVLSKAFSATGDWYVDGMGRIGRQMDLMNARLDPPALASDADGLPLPDWMGKYDAVDRQRARVAWISKNLQSVERDLAALGDSASEPEWQQRKQNLEAERLKWQAALADENARLAKMTNR